MAQIWNFASRGVSVSVIGITYVYYVIVLYDLFGLRNVNTSIMSWLLVSKLSPLVCQLRDLVALLDLIRSN